MQKSAGLPGSRAGLRSSLVKGMLHGTAVFAFLCLAGPVAAEIYKCKKPGGGVLYSDTRCSGPVGVAEKKEVQGSGLPRFDGTSEETASTSSRQMLDALSPDQAREFKIALMVLGSESIAQEKQGKSKAAAERELRDRLNGKTAAEIIALGQASERAMREKARAAAGEEQRKR